MNRTFALWAMIFISISVWSGIKNVMAKSVAEINHNGHEHGHEEEQEENESHDHNENGQGQHDEHNEGLVTLSSQQLTLANIQVTPLQPRILKQPIDAPGEVKSNQYRSYLVTPRVDSIVLHRYVERGEQVKQGQVLVRLFSEAIAEAQAKFRVANAEWQRVKKLGRDVIGEKRFIAAQADYEIAYGQLLAFGLSEKNIRALQASPSSQKAFKSFGEYTLKATMSGIVMSDDFHQGQRVESGETLMELVDERQLWVEAHLPSTTTLDLSKGTMAQISVGNHRFPATVTQASHRIDPMTRTRVVRLQVDNPSHQLHPGMFVNVSFSSATLQPILAVPQSALMRHQEGDWMIFVETAPNQFQAKKVVLKRRIGNYQEIQGIGIQGQRIVMKGAFFLASQMAKGNFDPHNH